MKHVRFEFLAALARLHAELGGALLENRKRGQKLESDMLHVEAVIRLLAPNYNVRGIAARRRYKSNEWFERGTIVRHALDVLRLAERPLTAAEIAERMLTARGIKDATVKQSRDLQAGVLRSLRNYEGRTVEHMAEGTPLRWALKGHCDD
jgi:hypothetical protein